MTEQETAKLLLLYSQYWKIAPDDMRLKVRAWALSMGDTPLESAQQALIRISRYSKFAPTPSEVIAEVNRRPTGRQTTRIRLHKGDKPIMLTATKEQNNGKLQEHQRYGLPH